MHLQILILPYRFRDVYEGDPRGRPFLVQDVKISHVVKEKGNTCLFSFLLLHILVEETKNRSL